MWPLRPSSLDDGDDPVAQTVKLYYDTVLRRCIAAYPWSFTVQESPLQRFPSSPSPSWKYAFHLPIDSVNLIALRPGPAAGGPFHDYELRGSGEILANGAELWARYQREPPVPTYPAHFTEFFVTSLIEELAGIFGHNLNTQSVYQKRNIGPFGALGLAIQAERMQNPPQNFHRPSRLALSREW
jgi:hypothetical protein